ncbi:MAG: CaiB/BaiF CoA transferase family protein [Alphaproteobacteria bacterium]
MPQPLDDIRVIELGPVAAGPAAGSLLGELGADVVKIEPPKGEVPRTWPPFTADGQSSQFLAFNRSKRGIALDLKCAEGRAVYLRLAARADVVIDNYRVGVTDKLGIGIDAVRAENPAVIYCAITGFGLAGPRAGQAATDQIAQAYTGVMSLTGEPGRPPLRTATSNADFATTLYAVVGVMAALRERDRTGKGCVVETSLADSYLAFMLPQWAAWDVTETQPPRWGSEMAMMAPYKNFAARDGDLTIGCLTERMYQDACGVLGAPALIDDPRFATNDKRLENRAAINAEFDRRVADFTVADLVERMSAKGVLCAPVHDLAQLAADPHFQMRGGFGTMRRPGAGDLRTPRLAIRFDGDCPDEYRPGPGLGEHTRAVLAEAGYGEAEIDALIATGAAIAGKE